MCAGMMKQGLMMPGKIEDDSGNDDWCCQERSKMIWGSMGNAD